ncbi:MAG: sulfite exporter TauE/SafE family protein [Bacteroidales bacterium]|nr:sulfite exporter TauE/SafE family protein [Bacteroidales bacterium]
MTKLLFWYLVIAVILVVISLISIFCVYYFAEEQTYVSYIFIFDFLTKKEFLIYLFVGFIAQLIDGSLGMAYGVSSTSFLMSTGVSPVTASTSVHIAEIFTTGISGFSHWKFGNVDMTLLRRLAIPGAIGAAIGAYALSSFDGDIIKPYVSAYLLIMGIIIIIKAFKKVIAFKDYKNVQWLALFGGFVDASGGGGWGPVVTTTLISSGNNPKLTIGTVNAIEFLVALTAAGVFTLFIGINSWLVIAGLIAGGAIAAPLGAFICNKINARAAMILVGMLIIFLSIRTLLKSFNLI